MDSDCEGIGMGLDFIDVGSGRDELAALLDRALSDMAKRPSQGRGADAFCLIVPTRLRPYAERVALGRVRDAVEAHGLRPGMSIGVHSFESFSENVVGNGDFGAYAKATLDGLALQAFVRRSMREDPGLFAGAEATHGFVALVAGQLEELVGEGVDPSSLEAVGMENDSVRMTSLARLMRMYDAGYARRHALTGDVASVIVPWAERHAAGQHWYLWGFNELSGPQLRSVEAVLRHGDVTAVSSLARAGGGLATLLGREQGVRAGGHGGEPAPRGARVAACANCVDEVRWVRDRIAGDLAEGVPAGDILVCARDLSPYRHFLAGEFAESGIVVNGVADASMADHAMADVLLGLLDSRLYAFDPSAIARVFSPRLIALRQSGFDDLRNYLATHVVGRDDWLSGVPFPDCPAPLSSSLEDLRTAIRSLVLEAEAVFGPQAAERGLTVRQALGGMVSFLARHRVDARLARRGDPAKRVWEKTMSLFDGLVDAAGDDPFRWHAATLARDLETALAGVAVAPPAALNGVDVSTYDVPLRPYRRIYCMGACRDAMPAVAHESDLLGDVERELLSRAVEDANPIAAHALRSRTIGAKSAREKRLFGSLTASATERIAFTYPRNLNGHDQQPSDCLDGMPEATEDAVARAGASAGYLPAPVDGGSIDPGRAARLFSSVEHGERSITVSISALETFFRNPFDYFAKYGLHLDPLQPAELDASVQGLYLHAVLERTVKALMGTYGDALRMPVSPSDSKPSMDEVRDLIRRYADINYRPAPDRDPGDANCPPTTLLEENPQFAVLDSDDRMRMVRAGLERRVARAAAAYARVRGEMIRRLQWEDGGDPVRLAADGSGARFRAYLAECVFGPDGGASMPALNYGTVKHRDGDVRLLVQGKVDRADLLSAAGRDGIMVIDYKSNGKRLFAGRVRDADLSSVDATESFYGRELQLMTYASAIGRMAAGGATPIVGAFFLPVSEPQYGTAQLSSEGDGQRFLSHDGHGGLPVARGEAEEIDLTQSGVLVRPLSCASAEDGEGGYITLSAEQFAALSGHARAKIREGAERLLGGDVGSKPSRTREGNGYRDGDEYSDYRDLTVLERLSDEHWDLQEPRSLQDVLDGTEE